jgi:hypothetical protein
MAQKLRAMTKATLLIVKVKDPVRIRIKALKVVLMTNRPRTRSILLFPVTLSVRYHALGGQLIVAQYPI